MSELKKYLMNLELRQLFGIIVMVVGGLITYFTNIGLLLLIMLCSSSKGIGYPFY